VALCPAQPGLVTPRPALSSVYLPLSHSQSTCWKEQGASCILMASFPPREYLHARCARCPSHSPNTAINRESRQTGRDDPKEQAEMIREMAQMVRETPRILRQQSQALRQKGRMLREISWQLFHRSETLRNSHPSE
jgi:hypothetical protein